MDTESVNPFRLSDGSSRELLRQLVGIPSVNPEMTDHPEWAGEIRMADALDAYLSGKGFRTERLEITPGRPNLIARLGAENPDRSLLFESHLDTVGVAGFQGDPFELTEAGGRLSGRGACDTKGPLASFLASLSPDVIDAFARSDAELIWAGTIGEETGNCGAEEVAAAGLRADHCVVLEPTAMEIVYAHKGVCWFSITSRGRAAHASDPGKGDNAILKMTDIWRQLQAEADEAAVRVAHPALGRPTVSMGTIRGGIGTNVVPDSCTIQVDRRLLPGETPDGVLRQIRSRLAGIPGGVTVELLKAGPAFATDPDAALPAALGRALEAEGRLPVRSTAAWCSDAGVLAPVCGQTVVWGPGNIAQAHTTEEYIDDAELQAATEILQRFLLDYVRS